MSSAAADLRRVTETLEVFHEDMQGIERAAVEHEQADASRFESVAKGNALMASDVAFIKDYLTVLQDQMIEGFRQLGARIERVEPRGKNGRER